MPNTTALYLLLQASPRFYKIFREHKTFHLSQLAHNQCRIYVDTFRTFRAPRLPKPRTLADTKAFVEGLLDDHSDKALIQPLDVSISLLKLGSCIERFTKELANNCHANLLLYGEHLELTLLGP